MLFRSLPSACLNLIAARACIELYQSPRGLVDGDAAFQMISSMSLRIEAKIDQYNAGQLRFLDNSNEAIQHPTVNLTTIPGNYELVHNMIEIGGIPYAGHVPNVLNSAFIPEQ